MKKLIAVLFLLVFAEAYAYADVIVSSPYNYEFYVQTGIFAAEGIVLCDSLTVRERPSNSAGKIDVVKNGDAFVSDRREGVWLHIYYADGVREGWVRGEYVLLNPGYYVADREIAAYAYGDVNAPRVAWLEKGSKLPIIKQIDGWIVVALRGASAWIEYDRPITTPGTLPLALAEIRTATMCYTSPQTGETQAVTITDTDKLRQLSAYFMDYEYWGEKIAGCGFGMTELALSCSDGQMINLQLAGDDCCTIRFGNSDFNFAINQRQKTNAIIFELFGILK